MLAMHSRASAHADTMLWAVEATPASVAGDRDALMCRCVTTLSGVTSLAGAANRGPQREGVAPSCLLVQAESTLRVLCHEDGSTIASLESAGGSVRLNAIPHERTHTMTMAMFDRDDTLHVHDCVNLGD